MSRIRSLCTTAAIVVGSSAALLTGGIAKADPAPAPVPAIPGLNMVEQLINPAIAPALLQTAASVLTGRPAAAPVPAAAPAPAAPAPLATAALNLPQQAVGTPAGIPAAPAALPGTLPAAPALPAAAPAAPAATLPNPLASLPGLPVPLPADLPFPTGGLASLLPALGVPAPNLAAAPAPVAAAPVAAAPAANTVSVPALPSLFPTSVLP